jgi:PilZ domain
MTPTSPISHPPTHRSRPSAAEPGTPVTSNTLLADPADGPLSATWPERRRFKRWPAHPKARVGVRRGHPGAGPDLGARLVNVSEDGVGVWVEALLIPGEAVEITLRRPRAARLLVIAGTTAWCRPAAGGLYQAGVRLTRSLTADEVVALAQSPR